ncbi:uncharacterized protein LOC123705335 [Colias croceus]|uniref:uncharacterized protein LOC123705335 n=1 Tax=Colias crocea TaxID=72248 RepID=UPI001E28178B|nr:uncharacterized protein LOC123705335 [Colias croceus]
MINNPKIVEGTDDFDEVPGPSHQNLWSPASNCTSPLNDSRAKIAAEMERMFDSDDSDKDPTYNPVPDSLIQPEDLFDEQWANNNDENLENVEFYGNYEVVQPKAGDLMIAQILPTSDAHQVVTSIWGLLLEYVCNATRKWKRWMKPEPGNWKDQCLACSNFNKANDEEKVMLRGEYDDHIERKESCNLEKAKDKERAERDKEFRCRSCSNIESQTMEDSFDSDEVSCDTSLLTQFTCIQNEDEEEAGEEEQEQEQEEEQEEDQEEDQEEEQEFETYE